MNITFYYDTNILFCHNKLVIEQNNTYTGKYIYMYMCDWHIGM